MKKFILPIIGFFLTIGVLASCSVRNAEKGREQETNDGKTEIANPGTSSSLVDTIVANDKMEDTPQDKSALEQSARDFVNQMYDVVLKSNYYPVNTTYFTSEFVNLFNKTKIIEDKRMGESDSDGGMEEQFFDDEFWSSYNDDPKGAKAKITKINIDENNNDVATASVTVKLIPEGNDKSINIKLIMTDKGWKISDYRGFKKFMQRYIKS